MIRINAIAAFAALLCSGATVAATINLSCGAVGQDFDLCKKHAEIWAKKTGNQVTVIAMPSDTSARQTLYQQMLSSRSDKIDVFQLDVVWTGMLAPHLADLKPHVKGLEAKHFARVIANNTVDGRLVAMPLFIDAGLLYYRKDLLQKYNEREPSTWEQLAASAKKIQDAERAAGNGKMLGFVWQGRAYEGLTCNALEWLVSFGDGTIVDADGKVTINNPNAARALQTAASWVGTISPTAVLNYAEEEARGVFQAGNAVFMRNWPYAWALAQKPDSPVKGNVGVSALPQGGPSGTRAATLGGQTLAVSKYSKNVDAAADLVVYMTGAEAQKSRALEASFNPTIEALYDDAEILQANPFMRELRDSLARAVARPAAATRAKYNQVSNLFWNTTHDVLSGKTKADTAVARLEKELNRISRGGKWQ